MKYTKEEVLTMINEAFYAGMEAGKQEYGGDNFIAEDYLIESNEKTNLSEALRDIITNYRISADMAYSEVTDGVHTQKEYKIALKNIEDNTCEEIQDIFSQEITRALESVISETSSDFYCNAQRQCPMLDKIQSNIRKYLDKSS